ncbi:hypothetical protein [Pseudomonas fluorescens]|uniref:hypothetical protein n=1 Tax=Pseudomonas fluorescens TaxID=294 RepID=UPI0014758D8B|nr:hypothetical protein [Pseudomonas fluorescens]NNB66950.1 hypothetical protein [Pseudomonas fluorescens]
MDEGNRWLKVNVHWLVLIAFLFLFLLFTWFHYSSDPLADPKLSAFVGGLAAAFFVAFVQFGLQMYQQIQMAKFRKHGVLDFLEDRTDRKFYRGLIRSAKKNSKIQVLGVTSNRMLGDFANFNEEKSQDLIHALDNGVIVQILLPKISRLDVTQASDFRNKTLVTANKLSERFPGGFSIRYFDSPASHSMFSSGSKCIVGPIFPDKSSKDTPAIVFDRFGSFVEPYIQNFDTLWSRSDESYE